MDEIPVNTSPLCAVDEGILLSTFPAEVWNLVFLHCDSNSLFLFSNSSQCLRNWLLSKRTAYLFPLVWIVLKDYYLNLEFPSSLKIDRFSLLYRIRDQDQEHPTSLVQKQSSAPSLRQIPPSSLEIISPQQFHNNQGNLHNTIMRGLLSTLEFRLVCKHWCFAVSATHLMELENENMNINCIIENQPTRSLVPCMETNLKRNLNPDKFEQLKFLNGSVKKARFIGRAIVIENYNPETYNILEQIGHEVWYCTMLVSSGDQNKDVAYLNIRNMLKLLPNLKSLEIDDLSMHRFYSYDQEENVFSSQRVLKVIKQNPIEKLEKLQVLQTKYLPFSIFDELLRSNSHIKTLVINRGVMCGKYNIWKERLSALEELSFEILKESDLELIGHSYVEWKLTRLYLKVRTGSVNWNRLLELFNGKWKHTQINLRHFDREWDGVGKDFCVGICT